MTYGTLTRVIEETIGKPIHRTLRVYHDNTQGPKSPIHFNIASYWIEFTDGSASEYLIQYNLRSHDLHADNYLLGVWQLPTPHDIPKTSQHSKPYRRALRWPERK